MILGRCLARNAQLYGDKPATIDEAGTILTHAGFSDRAWRIAGGLARRGIGQGSRVAILAENSPDYLCVHYALGAAGAWTVPVNTALKAPDIHFRLAHADVEALVVSRALAPMLDELPDSLRRKLVGRVIAIEEGTTGVGTSLAEITVDGRPVPPDVSVSPEDTLYIGYTSGTTGTPKGALVSHRAIVVGFLYKALAYGLTHQDVTLNPGPYWHSAPRDFTALGIWLGGTAVVPVRFDAERHLDLVERHRVTNSFMVPTMIARLTASESFRSRDLSSLRAVISGGAPLPGPVKERFLESAGDILTEFYGATETRIVTTISATELARKDRSVGRPTRDVEVRVLDEEGRSLPAGTVGEVFIRGPGLFSGYWRDPDRTAAAHRGEWFSLGDMGRLDEEGFLYLVDRKQDMIISGGENIFPNDIEECLERYPGVREAAVVGVPDEQWGEIVVAYVVPGVERPEATELIAHCAARLPGYMKPRRIEFRDALPRNPTGKLLRRVLREGEGELARTHETG